MIGSAPSVLALRFKRSWVIYFCPLLITLLGCSVPKDDANARNKPLRSEQSQPTAVDVAVASAVPLNPMREYTGTTQPFQEVAIRAQAEGQLRQLNVAVGDRVKNGQILAQIDDSLLNAATAEAMAELASRRIEIGQIQAQVSDAQTQVEQSRLQLQQAEFDAARYRYLATAGVISRQQAQQALTQAKTAAQVLRSAQAKVRAQQQSIAVANSRISAQQAVVNQQQQKSAYAMVMSPISGTVLTRSTEQGNLVQVGNELLRLGDFSQVKVMVQVSELDLANIRLNGSAKVRLDAFPTEQFAGKVTQISPVANPTSRLVPIEVTIANPTGRIGSGFLSRVSFMQTAIDRVVVPISALQEDRTRTRPTGDNRESPTPKRTRHTLFVIQRDGEQTKAMARSVVLGEQIDGKVQILSGLNLGERFVARSSKPLKDGDLVRLSILSAK